MALDPGPRASIAGLFAGSGSTLTGTSTTSGAWTLANVLRPGRRGRSPANRLRGRISRVLNPIPNGPRRPGAFVPLSVTPPPSPARPGMSPGRAVYNTRPDGGPRWTILPLADFGPPWTN